MITRTTETAQLYKAGLQVQVWRKPWFGLIAFHRIPWFAKDEKGWYRTAADASFSICISKKHKIYADIWHP